MKGLVILASVLLVLGILGVVYAAEISKTATVTVNGYASVTLSACSGTGDLSFGSGDPGTNDLAVTCQSAGTGAVTVTNDVISNTNINVDTKGTDFAYLTNIIAVNKLEFDEGNAKSSPTTLSISYQSSSTGVTPGSSVGVWYWLDIPSSQVAGSYSGTLSVRGQ